VGETMAVLVMDTATQVLCTAIGTQTQLLGSTALLVPRGHSRLLQPTAEHLLKSAGIKPSDLTLIGVGVGPGSYTGVRMAVSTAKAMASALSVPLVPISTLWTMAAAAVPGKAQSSIVICPLLYARRGRAFGAIYEKTGDKWSERESVKVLPVPEWMDKLRMHTQGEGEVQGAVIVHDFVESYGVLDILYAGGTALDIFHISDISGNLGPQLWRLTLLNRHLGAEGDAVHAVVPDYVLRVEAEVKLSEGSGSA
jgi:tRNA threonylcarbamoyladenosine biosynthesis protein TsaB